MISLELGRQNEKVGRDGGTRTQDYWPNHSDCKEYVTWYVPFSGSGSVTPRDHRMAKFPELESGRQRPAAKARGRPEVMEQGLERLSG